VDRAERADHVIGLSQACSPDSRGAARAYRGPPGTSEAMLEARTGAWCGRSSVRLRLTELRSRVAAQARRKAGSSDPQDAGLVVAAFWCVLWPRSATTFRSLHQ